MQKGKPGEVGPSGIRKVNRGRLGTKEGKNKKKGEEGVRER